MTIDFQTAHHAELADYFGGRLEAALGLRSWAGSYLDDARAAATSEDAPRPPREQDKGECGGYLPTQITAVSGSALMHTTPDLEVAPSAMVAARLSRRIERLLGRLEPMQRRTLAAYYYATTRVAPPGYPHGLRELGDYRIVAALLYGPEHVREIMQRSKSRNGVKKQAKAELANITTWCQGAVRKAQHAYAEVATEAKRERRADRRQSRVLRSLEQGPPVPQITPWSQPASVRSKSE